MDGGTSPTNHFPEGSPTTHDMRNDRSERLWGSDGQKRLAEAHIVLLGATAAGCETLKNTILPGLGRFTIVDNAKVTKQTLGTNFFVGPNSVGGFVAEETWRHLKELNPFAEGHFVTSSSLADFVHSGGDGFLFGDPPPELTESPDPCAADRAAKHYKRPPFNATLVIATPRVPQAALLSLSQQLAVRNIPLFYMACNGVLAYMRLAAPDMPVVDTVPGPDGSYFDPRVAHPFPGIQSIYEHLNPENAELSDDVFRHLPWPAVAYHAVRKWREANNKPNNAIPDMRERMDIKKIIKELSNARGKDAHGNTPETFDEAAANLFQVFSFQQVPSELRAILDQAPARAGPKSSAFWVFMAAIRAFYDENGFLPLNPRLPDFTTTTDIYRSMQIAFKEHHLLEVNDVYERAFKILKSKGMTSDHDIRHKIHREAVQNICAGASFCQFQHYPNLEDEVGSHFTRPFAFPASGTASVSSADADHMRWHVRNNEGDPTGTDFAQGWYTAIRAAWAFQAKHNHKHAMRAPGQPISISDIGEDRGDAVELTAIATKMWADASIGSAESQDKAPGNALPENVAKQIGEFVRYGGSEMGHIAAIIGAVASQECIKFIQHKRVPVTPWVIFDGNTSKWVQIECAI